MELHVQLVLTFLLLSECFIETKKIRGVSMSYRRLYKERKSFLCMDGSRLIPFIQVNDDYCDCTDGSDEPGTAACPNGRFYCMNLGFRPHYIPSSRVNDGICDCCDGSDEFNSQIQCPDKCRMLGQKERQELEERMKAVSEGLLLKKQLIEEGTLVWQEKQAQHKQLQKVAEDLKMKVEDYRKRKLKAEAKKEQLERGIKPDSNSVGDQSEWPGAAAPGDGLRVDNNRSSVVHVRQQEVEIHQDQHNPAKTSPQENPIIREAQSAVDSAVAELQKVEEAYDTVQLEIRELQEKLDIDYGPEREFAFLLSRCVEMTVSEYVYTLCPFSQVTQKSSAGSEVMLGKWAEWIGPPDSPYRQMKYDEGEACWQGPQRSTLVSLVCGTETELRSVKEPSKCLYSMELQTPAACSLSTPPRSVHNEL